MDREVWFIYPRGSDGNVTRLKRTLRGLCANQEIIWQKRQSMPTRSREGRLYNLLTPEDAWNLYKRIHRSLVGVCEFGQTYVQNDPSRKGNFFDGLTRLSEYVRYKALFLEISPADNVEACRNALDNFQNLVVNTECEGDNDPRCLPFHVFKKSDKWEFPLETNDGRRRFFQIHGSPAKRIDYRELIWTRGARHGSEKIHVAGKELSTGFHWDVSHPGKGGQSLRVYNSNQVWKLDKGGYVNVYPDAYLRKGNRAKRLWPSK